MYMYVYISLSLSIYIYICIHTCLVLLVVPALHVGPPVQEALGHLDEACAAG